jgi:hypothetical protein
MYVIFQEETDLATQLALAGVTSPVWSQATPLSAPQAHMSTAVSMDSQQISAAPPPAHAHLTSTNLKPPDSFLDKSKY